MDLNSSKIKQILGELKINLNFVIVKNSKILVVKLVLIVKEQDIFQENVQTHNKLEVEVELVIILALSVGKKVICQKNVLIHQNKGWEEEEVKILVLTAMNQVICQENALNLEPKEEEDELGENKILDVKKIMLAILGAIKKVVKTMYGVLQKAMQEIPGVIKKIMEVMLGVSQITKETTPGEPQKLMLVIPGALRKVVKQEIHRLLQKLMKGKLGVIQKIM